MAVFQIELLDWIVIIGYIVGSLILGFWVGRNTEDSEDYFLAGRHLVWPLVGFSLYASNMSGSSFVGLAGEGYSRGIAIFNYEWAATNILIFLVFFILPFFLRSKVYTIPEFLQTRFHRRSRVIFSEFTIFANMFIDAAAGLYAGGIVMQMLYPEAPDPMVVGNYT